MHPPPDSIDGTGIQVPDTEPFFRPLRPGEMIAGRYRIKNLIARGGQALVYLAEQEALERRVALKVMSMVEIDLDHEEGHFLERFQLEARTLAALDHPNIVRVHDFGAVSGRSVYFAMEFIDGEPMSRVLRKEPITRGEALSLMQQVIRALHYAHERGVVHRDLKFTNVLITRDREGQRLAKVVDFGIAKVNDSGDTLTRHGDVLGSPHFMSPEQISGTHLDHRTDIYSVGIMLYHIITGTYPFRADNPQGILAGHLMRTPIPMSDNPKGVEIPEKLEALVMRCLSKQAPDRYENMLVLADALSHFVEDPSPVQIEMPVGYQSGSGQLDPSTLAGVQYQSLSGGHWALMGALITSILGVLALIGYVIWLRFDDGKSDRAESQRDNDEAEKVEQKHDPTAEPVRTQAPIPEEEPTGLDPAEAQDAPPAPASQTDLSPTREETRSSRPTSDQTELRTASQPRPAHNDSADDRQPASEGYDNLDFSIDEMEVIDPWQD